MSWKLFAERRFRKPTTRRSYRPRLEVLEDRRLLAQVLNGGTLLQETFDDPTNMGKFFFTPLDDHGALSSTYDPSTGQRTYQQVGVVFHHDQPGFLNQNPSPQGTTTPLPGEIAGDLQFGPAADTITILPYLPPGASSAEVDVAAVDVSRSGATVLFVGQNGVEVFKMLLSGPPTLVHGSGLPASSGIAAPVQANWDAAAASKDDVLPDGHTLLGPIDKIIVQAGGYLSTQLDNVRAVVSFGSPAPGDVRGAKWLDPDGDGIRQPNEPGVPGVQVFVDLHRSGRFEPGYPSAVTDANGNYDIPNVPPGTYPVIDTAGAIVLSPPTATNADFGFSVAAGAGTIAVGDPLAFVYARNSLGLLEPVRIGDVTLVNAQDGSFVTRMVGATGPGLFNPIVKDSGFGFSVAIDSQNLAVGSPFGKFAPDSILTMGRVETFATRTGSFTDSDPSMHLTNPLSPPAGATQFYGVSLASIGGRFLVGGSSFNTYPIGTPTAAMKFFDDRGENKAVHYGRTGTFDSVAGETSPYLQLGGNPESREAELFGSGGLHQIFEAPEAGSFGTAVALRGNQAFVGAPAYSLISAQAGAIYRYDDITGTTPILGRLFTDPKGAIGDHFGFSMAIVGQDRILIGAQGDSTQGAHAGAVYLFEAQTGELLQTFYSPNPRPNAEFGFSIAAVDDHTFVVGAPSTQDNTDPGAAYIQPIAPRVVVAPGQTATANFTQIPGPRGPDIYPMEGDGSTTQTLVSFADPAALRGQHTDSATIDWGDGSTSTGRVVLDPGTGLFTVLGSNGYAEEGTYPVNVTVNYGSATPPAILFSVPARAVVKDGPVAATGGFTFTPTEGNDLGLQTLATFTDPGGPEFVSDYSATITWHDGTTSPGTISFDPTTNVFKVQRDRAYAEEGSYPIRVTILHDGAPDVTVTDTAIVADPAVAGSGMTISAVEGLDSGAQVVATFTDPAGPEGLADYSASIDWGDNTSSPATILGPNGGQFTVQGSHIYAEEGSFPISIVLYHDAAPDIAFHSTASVADAPLQPLSASVTAIAGGPFNGKVASFTDADPAGILADYSATIAWGDGNSSPGTITANGSGGFDVTGGNTYAASGSYSASVIIRDAGGSSVTALDSANVAALGQAVQPGLTGSIGFWHSPHGQALINAFNGGSASTVLANWLAATFHNLYGISAGAANLTGMTNARVADFYETLFQQQGPKLDAQVLSVALDVYATTLSLGGTTAAQYGFTVTAYGLGAYSFTVGEGDAFGVPDQRTLNVYQILKAVNRQAVSGILYNGDGRLRHQAHDLFADLIDAGSI